MKFGTDGVRGVAGPELTAEFALALGRAAARSLGRDKLPFLVGRDTRWSGPLLQAAFSAGVAAEGFDVVDLGVLPTPGVAWEAARLGVPAAVISASHNPYADNGLKLLAAGGLKLTDDQQSSIEGLVASAAGSASDSPSGDALGRLTADPGVADRYVSGLLRALEGRTLAGMRVAIDCGHGAAVTTAVAALRSAGASLVSVLGVEPDGRNINDGCGSTDPSLVADAVVMGAAAAGLAFDGDADRVIALDETGTVVDGDRILALLATDLRSREELGGGVVVTVMTNLGFHRAMESAGIPVATTAVGDRYVLEELEKRGWSLGGEQSGHVVFRRLATTGDGVLTGLMLLDLLRRSGRPLSELAESSMTRLPQVLLNVRVADQRALPEATAIWDEVRRVEDSLGRDGRVLLRASGTEPVIRVMVEAAGSADAESAAERLVRVVQDTLG